MPKIHVLEKHVAELIAAGEVVERPSSVVKEILENAVDAGATVITVEIRRGGITYIRVTDNGCGISAQDVPTAFLRHATSKIVQEQDLDAITTLGFRGEALASISAVSRVELLTRPAEEAVGTRYRSAGAEDFQMEEAGCPAGTTIIIRDLFFNTPARMKFLKKDVTEGNAVAGILDKIALSHPEISFRFVRDGKEQLHTPGDGKVSSAIYAVYGKDFSKNLIPVDYSMNHIRVSGYISTPAGSRANRSMQNFFINGRFIKSRTAGAALDEAFKGSIMAGKFAACVLNMEMSFATVDVNVHPAKLEVRFVNERPIFEVVYNGVKSALRQGDSPKVMEIKKPPVLPYAPAERVEQLPLQPAAGAHVPEAVKPPAIHQKQQNTSKNNDQFMQNREEDFAENVTAHSFTGRPSAPAVLRDVQGYPPEIDQTGRGYSSALHSIIDIEVGNDELQFSPSSQEAPVAVNKTERDVPLQSPLREFRPLSGEEGNGAQIPREMPGVESRLIGEAFQTYLILQNGPEELLLIDKHAAHERLLYEKLKQEHSQGIAQTLLEPIPVVLDKEECISVLENKVLLQSAGFAVEDFGAGTVLVRTAPLLLDGGDVAAAIMEIAAYLHTYKKDITTEHMDWVYHNVACRAAMKGGDRSSKEELVALAKKLEENPEIRYCPHGRPVSIKIKKRDLEKQFGRV